MPSIAHGAACLVWLLTVPGFVQPSADQKSPDAGREFFVSWGYNGNSFAKTDIHFRQPALGNDFTLFDVRTRDSKGWTDVFNHAPTVPQYNIRFGFFLNDKWGIEVALDHIKWIVRQDQQVRMSGTVDGEAIDTQVTLTTDVLKYQLNNGANPIFINLLRRARLARQPGQTGHVALLAKGGGGFAVPHTENTVFGQPNAKGFQPFHGWGVNAGAAIRIHVLKALYVEFEDKLLYLRYFGVNIDQGKARHSFRANEFTFNFGLAFR